MENPTAPALDVLQYRVTQLTRYISDENAEIARLQAAIQLFNTGNHFISVKVLNIDTGVEVVTIPIFKSVESVYDAVIVELRNLQQGIALRRIRLETELRDINRQLAAMGNDTSTGRHNGDQ